MFPIMHLLPESDVFSSALCNESGSLLSSRAGGRGSSAQGSAEGGVFSAQITSKENHPAVRQYGSVLPCEEQR